MELDDYIKSWSIGDILTRAQKYWRQLLAPLASKLGVYQRLSTVMSAIGANLLASMALISKRHQNIVHFDLPLMNLAPISADISAIGAN